MHSQGESFSLHQNPAVAKTAKDQDDRADRAKIAAQIMANAQYANKPSVPRQLEVYPGTVIDGRMQQEIFEITRPEELNRLNDFLEKCASEDPLYRVESDKEYFSSEQCRIFKTVWFVELLYLQIPEDRRQQLADIMASAKTQ